MYIISYHFIYFSAGNENSLHVINIQGHTSFIIIIKMDIIINIMRAIIIAIRKCA